MVKIKFIILFLLLLSVPSFGQTNKNLVDSSSIKRNRIKVSPLRVIRIEYPGLELSYERLIGKRFSTEISVRYLKELIIQNYQAYQGFGFSIQEKYFLTQRQVLKPYISGELVFNKFKAGDTGIFGYKNPLKDTIAYSYNYHEDYTLNKQTMSLNIGFGVQLIFAKKISIDLNAGLGLKYRKVTHTDRSIPKDEMEMPRHPNLEYSSTKEGTYYTPNFALNIKIGYVF